MEGLTEGRMVHYVQPSGRHTPAIVVKVLDQKSGVLNLAVFNDMSDGQNENILTECVSRQTSVSYNESQAKGTWHWIEKA